MSSQARLRTSCDACQSLKIKCSQNKPECERCVKHGLHCVYSPLRRMGRPRKRDASSQGAQFPSGESDAQAAQTEDTVPLAMEEEDVMSQWRDSTTTISLSLADSMHDTPFASDRTDRLASSVSCPGIASQRGDLGNIYKDAFMEDIQSLIYCQLPSLPRQLPTATSLRRNPNELKRKKLGLESQNIAPAANTTTSYAFNELLPLSSPSGAAMGRRPSLQDSHSELPEPLNRNTTDTANCAGNSQSARHHSRRDEASEDTAGLCDPDSPSFPSSSISRPAIFSSSDLFGEPSIPANSSCPQNLSIRSSRNWRHSDDYSRRTFLINDRDREMSSLATSSNRNGNPSSCSTARPASESDGSCQGQCYLTILRRLASLEHCRGMDKKLLAIDVVMTAERDTRLLKEQLFKCGRDVPEDEGCLYSRPSSLMALSLLAECVVSLFEDLFRRAAISAHERERIFRTAWPIDSSPISPSEKRTLSAHQSAARFERSIRGAFDRNITCPVPEANCDLFLGNFRVGSEAKSRAMRQILRRRIGKLLAMLVDIRRFVGPEGGVIQGSAKQIAEDLHHRVESLQGRVELAE
ncbi:uncharacterized protein N7479_002495 [Penicillium vulpinum]|uniref:Zn(2)-C6 fungal-type domain-containing protein n=1 Tax=Penicillium vulpinum TaxID=29845 RepID=A0A1V6RHC1_9EURO|nr:uncharacterized protein N7479_002495 [Penicillium vulpinum]KAJ5972577.1 hypothetical protein N7479_002495 [Penicillium vulpinum]OQE01217.1 hypothetical protein PENVUL_c044G08917 [Penicillium vulpinum]